MHLTVRKSNKLFVCHRMKPEKLSDQNIYESTPFISKLYGMSYNKLKL